MWNLLRRVVGMEPNEMAALRMRANAGDARAQFNLGHAYRNGQGVPQDDAEAVLWYRKAAEEGHAGAQINLGNAYATGEGVPKDDTEAYKWFNLATTYATHRIETNSPRRVTKPLNVSPRSNAPKVRSCRVSGSKRTSVSRNPAAR